MEPNNTTAMFARERIVEYLREFILENDDISEVDIGDQIVRYFEDNGSPLVFDAGHLWRYDDTEALYVRFEEHEMRNVMFDLDRAPQRRGGHLFRLSKSKCRGALDVIQTRSNQDSFFREAPIGINVENGFITFDNDQREVRLEAPCAMHRQRTRLHVPYVADASLGEIDGFLIETLDDRALVDLVYEIVGVALFGRGTKYQRAFILLGKGRNGKGVVAQLIQRLIPFAERSSVPPAEWRTDYQRYPLVGSRLNVCAELPPLTPKDMETFKLIITGDTITARRVGGSGFEFEPRALQLFAANRLPNLPEIGLAIARRLLVIPFDRTVPENQVDPHHADMLWRFGSVGFLRSAVEGFQRVLTNEGYTVPHVVKQVTDDWVNKPDPIKFFIEDCIDRTGNSKDRVSSTDMWKRWERYQVDHDHTGPTSPRALKSALERHGLQQTKSGNMQWVGVRVRKRD